jgi:hypothetical protein
MFSPETRFIRLAIGFCSRFNGVHRGARLVLRPIEVPGGAGVA